MTGFRGLAVTLAVTIIIASFVRPLLGSTSLLEAAYATSFGIFMGSGWLVLVDREAFGLGDNRRLSLLFLGAVSSALWGDVLYTLVSRH